MTPAVLGFVGLGNMGGPMAANLAAAGFALVCFDAAGTAERMPPGATAAEDLAEVAARVDTVMLSLPDGRVSLAVGSAIAAAIPRRVTTVIDLSTVGPAAAAEAAAVLAEVGVTYVDGPVSGGVDGRPERGRSRSCTPGRSRPSKPIAKCSTPSPGTSSTPD